MLHHTIWPPQSPLFVFLASLPSLGRHYRSYCATSIATAISDRPNSISKALLACLVFLAQSEPCVALSDLFKIGTVSVSIHMHESLERVLHVDLCISILRHQPIRKELTLCSVARLGEASGMETMIQLSLCLIKVLLMDR